MTRSVAQPLTLLPVAGLHLAGRLILGLLGIGLVSAEAQAAAEQVLDYDLRIDGQKVGSRTLRIRYLPADVEAGGGETRILTSTLSLDATAGTQRWTLESRCSAVASDTTSSFTCAVRENGALREVAARRQNDGSWAGTITDAKQKGSYTWRRSEVSLSSMDLADPILHAQLYDAPSAGLLVAEAGVAVAGAVVDGGEEEIKVGGQTVTVHRYSWTPSTGKLSFSWSNEGILLAYELSALGKTVKAVAKSLPPARDYGEVEMVPFGGENTIVREEPL